MRSPGWPPRAYKRRTWDYDDNLGRLWPRQESRPHFGTATTAQLSLLPRIEMYNSDSDYVHSDCALLESRAWKEPVLLGGSNTSNERAHWLSCLPTHRNRSRALENDYEMPATALLRRALCWPRRCQLHCLEGLHRTVTEANGTDLRTRRLGVRILGAPYAWHHDQT